MARLQQMYLPGNEVDGVRVQPFALLVDQVDSLSPADEQRWKAFADDIGAAGVLVVDGRVDLVDTAVDDGSTLRVVFDAAELASAFAEALRSKIEAATATAVDQAAQRAAVAELARPS